MQQRQRNLLLIFDKPEDEGIMVLSNAGIFEALHVDAGSHPRKFESSSIPPRKYQTREVVSVSNRFHYVTKQVHN
jgi:hypothetical protein